MVEAKKHGHVLVGNSARNLNTRQKTFDPETAISVHFGRTVIDSIWKTKQECEKVHSVYKLSDLVTDEESLIQDFLDADNAAIKKVTDIPTMSWQAVQSILDGSDRPNLNSKPAPERTWDEEIACELQMSVEERFGMSLNDAALQGMSEDDLEELHVEIETSIRSLMVEHFFGSFFRLLILLSPAKYRHGVNDQVVPASSLNLSDESQEFLSPVENILSGIPFTRSWFAPENKAKQKRFEDTDVSLREKIKKEAVSHLIVATGSSKSVGMSSARDSIKSIARCHARSNNPTNRLPNLPLSTGLSRRNIGSVHPCLFTSEMDSSQHLYGGECKYEYDENIKLGPRVSTRTLFSGEYSNQSNQDVTLSSSISRFVQYKPQGSVRSKHMPVPSILKQRSFAGTLKGSSKYNEAEEFPVKIDLPGRGLEKYTSDARSISNAYVGVCFCLLALYAVLLCIVDRSYMYQIGAVKPSYIFGFLALNFLFLNLTERKYDRIVCVVLFVLRCLMIVAVMPYLAGDSNVFTEGNNIKYLQGNTLLVLGLWFPIALRQSFLFNCLELVLHILGSAYVRNITHVAQHRTLRVATARMVPIIVFFLLIFWAIEYLCILSYVIENILVPEAQTLYQREYVHAREMLHACSPNIPLDKRHLYCPRRYRSCSVLAIHVKAADVLPGLVDALSVASFMKEIMLLMDGCVKECGLLKVTHFSGIFIAACPDIIDDNTPINYMTRTVMCLRKIQTKLDAFSRRNSVNVSIGAGLSCGSVTMGLLGNTRFCFDVSGAARDLAIFMASHQNDGIFALESFGPHFRDGQLSDDLVVREVTVTAGHKTMKWLQLDGAFNKGMQLDDFEYMCMLGRGGFGSVHLLWENATEKEYAIKAIPRKRGSAIPKMIQREFIILQQIQHANVVSFKCCIINKAMIYLVMSYVRGGNLKQIVERNKPDLKHLTLWFAELVLALNYIHSLGIIHRDVKPANCMIGELSTFLPFSHY
jgi:Protein kinase domain